MDEIDSIGAGYLDGGISLRCEIFDDEVGRAVISSTERSNENLPIKSEFTKIISVVRKDIQVLH